MPQPPSDPVPSEPAAGPHAEGPASSDAPLDLNDPALGQTFEMLAAEIRARLAEIEAREAALERGHQRLVQGVRRLRRLLSDPHHVRSDELDQLERELARVQRSLAADVAAPSRSSVSPDIGTHSPTTGSRPAVDAQALQRHLLERMEDVRRRQRELSERLAAARRRIAVQRVRQGPEPDGAAGRPVGGARPPAPQAAVVATAQAPAAGIELPPPGPADSHAVVHEASPRSRLALRAAIVALTVAMPVGFGLWLAQRPQYEARGSLRVLTDAEPVRTVVGGYTARLLGPPPPARFWPRAEGRSRWRALRARGAVQVEPDVSQRTIRVRLRDTDADVGGFLTQALQVWKRHLESLPPQQRPDPRLVQWKRQRELVAQELSTLRRREAALRAQLGPRPTTGPATQPTTGPAWQQLERDVLNVQQQLADARRHLASLEDAPEPVGVVDEAQLQAALARDPVYQEDLRELRAAAKQLREDLAVTMVLLDDPLRTLRGGLMKLGELITEQRRLKPPAEVAAVLDTLAQRLDNVLERVSAFVLDWQNARQGVERLKLPDQLGALLEAADEADARARQLVLALQRRRDELGRDVAPLDAGDAGSTRAVIVAAMLRGELTRLDQQIKAVAAAAAKLSPRNNPTLDAGDRQVRNLRARLDRRRTATRARLQQQADARARARHARAIEQARQTVAALEHRRDELTEQLIAAAGHQGQRAQLEAQIRQRSGQLRAIRESIRRAEQKLAELDRARQAQSPIRLQPGPVEVRPLSGQHRARNTTLGAAAVSLLVWLVCMLVFSGRGAPTRDESAAP